MNTLRYTYKFIDGSWKLQGGNMSGIDEKNGWSIPHWPHEYPGEWTDTQAFCNHKWVDTGMTKTFCKECDADGEYDPMTGKITVVYKKKEDKK